MQQHIVNAALIVASAMFLATAAMAADNNASSATAPGKYASTPGNAAKAKPKASAPAKLVDINRAGKAELKRLPGVGDAEADKIIAGRPYLSKADLVTRGILPAGVYDGLKKHVMAKPKSL